ncbi:MAG: hypothetical protein Q8K86_08340 [Candidatus Nanopelagicaceae bacterium]|nr:hypothetical protein [Candidatus Nanopelagicaceae bacterium]
MRERLEHVLKEDASPKIGIWYYLWLKPSWRVQMLPVKIDEKAVPHMKAWSLSLVEDLAEYYGLLREQKEKLQELPWCMPRGRVDYLNLATGKPLLEGKFVVYHGNDFPTKFSQEGEIKKIISEFDLTSLHLQDRVQVIQHEHERMNPQHQKEAQEILGPIPY